MEIGNIKFKAKRLDNREWEKGSLVVTDLIGWDEPMAEIVTTDGMRYEVDPSTVCQFIGLKDRNGVEVYENDIVKSVDWEEKICNVEYKDYGFCLCSKSFRHGVMPLFVAVDNCDIYVIGNKFDNKN